MSERLIPNSPLRRAEWVTKTYGPYISAQTFLVLSDMLGIEELPSSANRWDEINNDILDWLERTWGRRRSPADKLWPWVARELSRALSADDNGYTLAKVSSALKDRGSAIAMWQKVTGVDILSMDAWAVLNELESWTLPTEPGPPGKVVAELSDGWTAVELPAESLRAEGEIMQNCLQHGYYDDRVSSGDSKIYSLRDRHGRPHIDIEYLPAAHRNVQEFGKQNDEPATKYLNYLDEFNRWLGVRPNDRLTTEDKEEIDDEIEDVAMEMVEAYESGDIPDLSPERADFSFISWAEDFGVLDEKAYRYAKRVLADEIEGLLNAIQGCELERLHEQRQLGGRY